MGPPFFGESKGRPEDPYIGYIYGDTVDGSEIELTTWDIKFPASNGRLSFHILPINWYRTSEPSTVCKYVQYTVYTIYIFLTPY